MTQHFLAHQLQGIFRATSELPKLQESLERVQAYDPIHLVPGQLLSAEHVEHAQTHQVNLAKARQAIEGQQEGIKRAMDKLLVQLPDTIKDRVRAGLPLVAQWQADGIEPLALIYKNDAFAVHPYERADELLNWLKE